MPSEKDLDLALHQALVDDEALRAWLLSTLKYGVAGSRLVLCRSDHPWCKVRLILPNKETGALEPVDREGETDVLAVFEDPAGRRLGVHIENKLRSGAFTLYQAEVCAARAELWVERDRFGGYHAWETVLLAPASFIERNHSVAMKYMTHITHESIAEFVPVFGRTSH